MKNYKQLETRNPPSAELLIDESNHGWNFISVVTSQVETETGIHTTFVSYFESASSYYSGDQFR